MSAVAQRIRQRREEFGWSQQLLADMLRAHKKTIQNYESGRTKPKGLQLYMLQKVLGCSLTNKEVENDENETRKKAPTTG